MVNGCTCLTTWQLISWWNLFHKQTCSRQKLWKLFWKLSVVKLCDLGTYTVRPIVKTVKGRLHCTCCSINLHSYTCNAEMQAYAKKFCISLHSKVQVWWTLTCKFVSHEAVWPIEEQYVTTWPHWGKWSRLYVFTFWINYYFLSVKFIFKKKVAAEHDVKSRPF